MVKIPLEFIALEGDGNHILVDVVIADQTLKMVIDTGASKTVFDRSMLIDAGVAEENILPIEIYSSGLGTNTMQSFMTTIPALAIGDWSIQQVETAVLDLSSINAAYQQMNLPPVVGVLGGDILYQYGAIINYKSKQLQLNQKKFRRN